MTTTAQRPVRIQTRWFQQGYAHGVSGAKGMPSEPSEQAVVNVIQRILAIVADDGEISSE